MLDEIRLVKKITESDKPKQDEPSVQPEFEMNQRQAKHIEERTKKYWPKSFLIKIFKSYISFVYDSPKSGKFVLIAFFSLANVAFCLDALQKYRAVKVLANRMNGV